MSRAKITCEKTRCEYYQAILDKDSNYDGVFFVGVVTTGIFCRSTCPARKPKFENCEFYSSAQEALLAGFRPCKRCQPLSHPNQVSDLVRTLVQAVEAKPEKRWKAEDFQALSIDVSTARRQFKKRFGMTFVQYARARRLGLAIKHIKSGDTVIDAQLSAGYESSSGFRDAFTQTLGAAPSKVNHAPLKSARLDTALGVMLAIADDAKLYLLEFVDRQDLEQQLEKLRKATQRAIIPDKAAPLEQIESELAEYFAAKLEQFQTPIAYSGTAFQCSVWDALKAIPLGETRSYTDIADSMGKPKAARAVASANSSNPLAIIIPCHRVLRSSGKLGGYGGGLIRKEWLLNHELNFERNTYDATTESRSLQKST